MSLLRASVFRNSHILAEINFDFLKNTSYMKLQRLLIPNLDLGEKIGNVVIK